MADVISAAFGDQVFHVADAEDAPVCGAESDGAFVADQDKLLGVGRRWCGACRRVTAPRRLVNRIWVNEDINCMHSLVDLGEADGVLSQRCRHCGATVSSRFA